MRTRCQRKTEPITAMPVPSQVRNLLIVGTFNRRGDNRSSVASLDRTSLGRDCLN
jgi:hypothetical protein